MASTIPTQIITQDGGPPRTLADALTVIDNTLSDLNDEYVNVRAYGAVGDGVADDTAAIQSAATAAAGKGLRFPQGTYKISARINLSSNTTVVADGIVTITQVTPGEIVFYGGGASNITIRGFTLVGPGSA